MTSSAITSAAVGRWAAGGAAGGRGAGAPGRRHDECAARVAGPLIRLAGAGDAAAIADTPWGRLGLTICYDIRFPHLHRQLAKAGASMIAVPAAFTAPTGEAHWETLLRARAIETGAFVLAPAQGGLHEDGRRTWGRSTVVGPWGEIIAKADHDEPCIVRAKLDMEAVARARAAVPSLTHDRDFLPAV